MSALRGERGDAWRRGLWLALWAGLGIWLGRATLLPAAVRGTHLDRVSGARPSYAWLHWSFGAGARPASVIFDIELPLATGSVTTDGEALEAEVPLIGTPESGPYLVVASATYRILGRPRTVVYRFTREV